MCVHISVVIFDRFVIMYMRICFIVFQKSCCSFVLLKVIIMMIVGVVLLLLCYNSISFILKCSFLKLTIIW
eukprot:UN04407